MSAITTTLHKVRFSENISIKQNIIAIAGAVAFLTICSWIKIPMIVPVTLQTFAIYVITCILGTKRGTAAVASYIMLGLCGAPVFSGFAGGPAYLLGPTGGYIIGFLFTAMITGALAEHFKNNVAGLIVAMLAGTAVCYAFGTVWFALVYCQALGLAEFSSAFSICVLPFLIPNAIKIAAAAFIVKALTSK